jgi:hypothetical protein
MPDIGERYEGTADRLLAHPAVTEPDLPGCGIDGESHSAALAAAGVEGSADYLAGHR